ncbi:ABC transporter substrate-binding protein [Agromyces protaetiae]|uniref:ABC transporter substrate-binding protein n=1 Tax=Agromyces protaetiae TaxID=2509455 RepID=A0A4P6FDI0_9MICO|nr:ABC transporter substrate-binding protein [Agromyces protaetiae]QAY73974.1 ABC transporter substrate-binding protein [Agromyces protaetiae]
MPRPARPAEQRRPARPSPPRSLQKEPFADVRFPRPTRLALAASVAGALLLAGCAPAAPGGGEASEGGTLVYASGDAEPTCLDPHVGGNFPQALAATQFLESLVSRDASGQIIPWLAEEWQVSLDGLTWDFTLKDDVEFTDGTPFDAAAVKANVEHVQDPETGSSTGWLALAKIAEVEVVAPDHARFHLSAPDSALLESLSQPWTAIESPAGIERGTDENCLAPIGTGPFIVKDWVKQDRISFVRNDDYNSPPADAEHDGPTALDGIEWRFIADPATRYAALQSGDVDVIDNAQPDAIAAASEERGITHLDAPRPGASNRIEFNSAQAPFDDVRVREAFVRAVDVDAGIEGLFFDTAPRSFSPLSSVEPTSFSDPSLFTVDPDEANRLLDEAGWTERDSDGTRMKDGARLTARFPVSTNQSVAAEQSLFEQLAKGAADVGFDVQITLLDLSSWYGALAAHEYELVSAPYTKVGPDVLRIVYHSASTVPAPSGYFANLAQVKDPEIDAALDAASASQDEAERADLYKQVQQRLLEQFHLLPIYDQQNHFLISTKVEGVRAMPTVSTPTFLAAHFVG